jgi:hypothetical protein
VKALLVCALVSGAAYGEPAKMTELASAIAKLPKDGDPRTLALPKGVTLERNDAGFTLGFSPPVDARELAQAFQWKRPYAVSGDVHQNSWRLTVWTDDLKDPWNNRIATEFPRVGLRTAYVDLDGRPEGELPKLVSGASPAYDLLRFHAKVTRIALK